MIVCWLAEGKFHKLIRSFRSVLLGFNFKNYQTASFHGNPIKYSSLATTKYSVYSIHMTITAETKIQTWATVDQVNVHRVLMLMLNPHLSSLGQKNLCKIYGMPMVFLSMTFIECVREGFFSSSVHTHQKNERKFPSQFFPQH